MEKNKHGEWIATKPTDLIGWEVRIEVTIEPNGEYPYGAFIVTAQRRGSNEVRTVVANQDAIPVIVLQAFQRRD